MSGATLAGGSVEQVRVDPDLSRQRAGLRDHARIDRIDVERQRQRDVLQHRERLDQDAARGDHADAIERLQPGVAVGDGAGVVAEQRDVAGVGQRRAGDEMDEGLGAEQRRFPKSRTPSPGRTVSSRIRSGRSALVVLHQAADLEQRLAHDFLVVSAFLTTVALAEVVRRIDSAFRSKAANASGGSDTTPSVLRLVLDGASVGSSP